MNDRPHRFRLGTAMFDDEFQSAVRDDGLEVRFTRTERRLLNHMARSAGRVLSRNQLLDAISGTGSDKSDRNIDFTINRLRRKLNDDPKEPTFIATRYGEGYVWVAKAISGRPLASGAHVVIGPVRGLNAIASAKSLALGFAQTFQLRLARHFGPTRKVVLDPECPPNSSFGEDCPDIAVDLTFLSDEGLDCVFRAVAFRTGKLYCVLRHRIADAQAVSYETLARAEAIAERIALEIWRSLALQPEMAEPLPLRLHQATANLTGGQISWQESERRLRHLLAEDPNDHAAKLMLATAIHTKYIENGIEVFMSGTDTRSSDEHEIEALVTASLPFIQDEPFYAITAAKLLYFIDRGYRRMAIELAEAAHRSSTSIAASLAIIGQMRAFVGEIEQGLASLDQALELSEADSQFQLYLLTMKAQAQMARGDRAGLDSTLDQLCRGRPGLKLFLDVMFTCPTSPSAEALAVLQSSSEARARAILMFVYYVNARLFQYEDHRENILRTPVMLFSKRFGPSIIPEEVAAAAPSLTFTAR